ncbi:phosphoribosyltransferase family protein [Williamsia maris]|uniref:Phosphoribosyltransferase n=1 Tax=Williamsia maris TaxID=72806 RepID=A0ABT1HJX0_9NOCA|nr:phosphoribosyltransferase family protein [Williamsia maris]MCP2178218.1 putative phosphoribosyltransferase [Williamsia maris]
MTAYPTSAVTPWAGTELGLVASHVDGAAGWTVDALIEPGLRRNPKRAHLWVSRVLGKHIPVAPSTIVRAGSDLADLVDLRGADSVIVFGFAETATGLGHVVARRLDAPVYLHSTRRPGPVGATWARFSEGHSHATDHLIQPSSPELMETADVLVLVDDEISTGATALDAIRSLHRLVPQRRYIVAALVDMRSEADVATCDAAAAELYITVDFVSLARGVATVPADLVAQVAALPDPQPAAAHHRDTAGDGEVIRVDVPWSHHVPDGGRHGFLSTDEPAFAVLVDAAADALAPHLDPRRPVVVIGHEELMYLPLRIAAVLETQGRIVLSQTTTRSPAHVRNVDGYPLRHGFAFTAPEVRTSPDAPLRYLYNAGEADPLTQRVLVVDAAADTDALVADDSVIAALTGSGRDLVVLVVGDTRFGALAAARGVGR